MSNKTVSSARLRQYLHVSCNTRMSLKFQIESVFSVITRGKFVAARPVDSNVHFRITERSTLGGIPLRAYLDMPRSIDENGKQQEIFVFHLQNPEDASKLNVNSIVELQVDSDVDDQSGKETS
jgi:hypothetical protein